MKITKANLYKDGKCRFCGVLETEAHWDCWHGMGDFLGEEDLGLVYKDADEISNPTMKVELKKDDGVEYLEFTSSTGYVYGSTKKK